MFKTMRDGHQYMQLCCGTRYEQRIVFVFFNAKLMTIITMSCVYGWPLIVHMQCEANNCLSAARHIV